MQSWTIASPTVGAEIQALGGMVGPARSLLAASGVSTARRFAAGERLVTRYAIGVEPLD